MKTNTITTPAGCKIAKTEIINGNLIVTYERDLPDSVRGIKRNYGCAVWVSTDERAEAILALGQLLELAAYVGCEKVNVEFIFGVGKGSLADDFHKKYSDLFKKTKKLL